MKRPSVEASVASPRPQKKAKKDTGEEANPSIKSEKPKTKKPIKGKKNKKNLSQEAKKKKLLSIKFPAEGTPKWTEIKEQSKLLKKERKMKKYSDLQTLIEKAKKKFEIIRNKKTPEAERNQCVQDLADMLKGNLVKLAKTHDMGRVIQWLLKLGPSNEIKESISKELLEELVILAQGKYSSHIVDSILRFCKTQKRNVILHFQGHVLKLISNKFSAPVIETIYTKHAGHKDKWNLRKELYGELLKTLCSNSETTSLSQILADNAEFQSSVLNSTKEVLVKLLNKEWVFSSSLYMSAVHEYLSICNEKDKLEVVELLKPNILNLIKTKEGAHVAAVAIRYATAKEKKELIKELKTNVVAVAMTDGGSFFLLHLFDSVDDTVIMKKALVQPLISETEELLKNDHGRKVIAHLVAHRDTRLFHPSQIEQLKKADESEFVKKDQSTRAKELITASLPPLLGRIKTDPSFWLKEGANALLAVAILTKGSGQELDEALAEVAAYATKQDISDTVLHMVMKKLIKNDPQMVSEHQTSFSSHLMECLNSDLIQQWCQQNRGCFTLVHMLETGLDNIVVPLKKKLEKKKILSIIQQDSTSKGAQVLLKMLK